MADGSTKRVQAVDSTKTSAINRLKTKLRELSDEVMAGDISPDTRVIEVAKQWLAELETEYRQSGKSMDTIRQYRSYVYGWVKKSVGELTCRELQTQPKLVNNMIQRCREKRSYDAAKSLRAVISGVCQYAMRNGAMKSNPVKSTQRLSRGEKKTIKALSVDQRVDLVAKVRVFGKKRQKDKLGRSLGRRGRVWLQLADLIICMLSTGVRVGEVLAVSGEDVFVQPGTVRFAYHLVPAEEKGVVRMPLRKGNEGELILTVPGWSIPIWRRLKLAAGTAPLFPSFSGGWLAPGTMIHRIREAFDECGYAWVTSHVFRKTVTAVLDEAGLSTKAIADQLGNTPEVVERHYRAPRTANAESAAAMETLMIEEAG